LRYWVASRGVVGRTARAVAKGYESIRKKNPLLSQNEIAEAYINIRYNDKPDLEREVLNYFTYNRIKLTPLNVTWVILAIEHSDDNKLIQHKSECQKMIRNEIEKLLGLQTD